MKEPSQQNVESTKIESLNKRLAELCGVLDELINRFGSVNKNDENPFLEGSNNQILRPSKAYLQATASYPHRISELVFGSLLASYILGFVSIGVSRLEPNVMPWWLLLSDIISYLTISCSFSFLTAAFYSVYHNSILTMPNVPIADLTTDFLIAISTAVFFGVSVIWPNSFLVSLGLLLLIVFLRQQFKFRALAKHFYERLNVSPETTVTEQGKTSTVRDQTPTRIPKPKKIHQHFKEKLKEVNDDEKFRNRLDGWGQVSLGRYFSGIALIMIGVVLIYVVLFYPTCFERFEVNRIRAIIYLPVGVALFFVTRKIIKDKSIALDDYNRNKIEEMDEAAEALVVRIKSSTLARA